MKLYIIYLVYKTFYDTRNIKNFVFERVSKTILDGKIAQFLRRGEDWAVAVITELESIDILELRSQFVACGR